MTAAPASARWVAAGAASAFVAVVAGAFGAHALRDRLAPDLLAIFETGARYQMFHALALLACGALPGAESAGRRWAARLFVAGTFLFSGSLYILALTGVRAWGAVTPLGGAAWLVAWALLAVSAWTSRRADP